MNSGPIDPTSTPVPNDGGGGGRGRRRRRRGRRRHGGGAPEAQAQGQQQQQALTPEAESNASGSGESAAPQQGAGQQDGSNQQGHFRKRKRKKHFKKGGPDQPVQEANRGGQPQHSKAGAPQHRREQRQQRQQRPQGKFQQQGPRKQQGRKFQSRQISSKAPDAGIYSAPMDHSYRSTFEHSGGNGNGNGNIRSYHDDLGVDALPNGNEKPIYVFVDDLFFLAKIQETARKLNVRVNFVKPEKEVLDSITGADEKPSLIIFDLNSTAAKPLTVIPKLKAKLKKATNIIGFLSHVQGDLKVKALDAGCDMVLPRSAFSQNLPQLLRRHAADDVIEDEIQPIF